MRIAIERLKAALLEGAPAPAVVETALAEYEELAKRADRLEELLIMIVRTGWPWDEEGEPNAIFHASREGFSEAMAEARELLALGRSRLTRTEPRT